MHIGTILKDSAPRLHNVSVSLSTFCAIVNILRFGIIVNILRRCGGVLTTFDSSLEATTRRFRQSFTNVRHPVSF